MENIDLFLKSLSTLGVPKHDQFQTIDLYENKNIVQVIDTIFALSRHAVSKGFNGPLLGPKLAEKREVVFSEETLAEGKAITPLWSGFSKGASQTGISFGGRRDIGAVDPGKQ